MEANNILHLQGIAHLLVNKRLICYEQAKQYQHLAKNTGLSLINYLVRHQIISAQIIALCLKEHYHLPFIDLDTIDKKTLPLSCLHPKLYIKHHVLPLFVHDKQLIVATDDPSQQNILKEIQHHTSLLITPYVVEADKLNILLEKISHEQEYQALSDYFSEPMPTNDEGLLIKFINRIISDAIEIQASDIHFEPYEQYYRIRYRKNGLLTAITSPPIHIASRIATRLKIMANLDITERRFPQDGRFSFDSSDAKTIDCRVNTCPVVSGEKIAIRLLNTAITTHDLTTLPFEINQRKLIMDTLSKPQGMILITGPTGSGKTSTLYAMLNFLNQLERNISTAEDPVEINIPGINQVHINAKIGLTFATVLRAFLRQDPDVMMVGEIRDLETADIAIKAAQTGHLVLSTLHTNSAAQTITRLINIGVQAFNIIDSVNLILAQRLIRCLCSHCKVIHHDLTEDDLIINGLTSNDRLFKANGCHHCDLGYQQRIAIFEAMVITPKLNQLILNHAPASAILQQAQLEGMITLYQAGLTYVKNGITSLDELRRVSVA